MKVNENVCLPLKENSSAVKTETRTDLTNWNNTKNITDKQVKFNCPNFMTYTVPRALIKRHKKNLPVRAMHKFSSRALESHTAIRTVLQHAEGTKKERKTNKGGPIMKCLLTELGRATRENLWLSPMHDLVELRPFIMTNDFPAGAPTQLLSTSVLR